MKDVTIPFPALHEIHSLAQFQSEGHFVPALRHRDASGSLTQQPRKWKGTKVHVLTLLGTDGQAVKTMDARGTEVSLIRVLSDSLGDAERRFADAVRELLYAMVHAQRIAGIDMEQFRRVKDERDRLVAWMQEHASPADLARMLGISEAAVEEHKRAQYDQAMKSQVEAALQGRV